MIAVLLLFSTFLFLDQISGTELEAEKGGPEAAEGSQGGIQVKKICDEVKFYYSVLFFSFSLRPGVVEEKSCFFFFSNDIAFLD